ncbi:MAG: hypothetical protein PUG08_02230 [Parafannyhessea umbonata]|uniref:hypothetical protein n=1 Tax=Parafannyhessea TaxID=2847312 RepID=UPI0026EE4A84|nr:hypothetical protein [Parafannyhessea umbonata]MDD6358772.1 hypothetical protein [Parafannyhessea umbonata]MDD6602545.1 hypothetical protein [Parafannyhessea umbonata]
MPRHAAPDWDERTQVYPATQTRRQAQGAAADAAGEMPADEARTKTYARQPYVCQAYQGQQQQYAATPQRPYVAPVESPRQTPFSPQGAQVSPAARRASGRAASWLLKVVAIACRLYAIALAALVVANAAVLGSWRIHVVELTAAFTAWLPSSVSGTLVYQTPFGGVLRGDFVAVAIALFVIDWLLVRKARSLGAR